ncbi:MAG: HNH endonuclease [Betaproteobacteria bacterium]|jgi:5-methylcytosine-specific restriction endonuclease McrA|nr:HNH endonuclease [Betaproteobacteria bacterium]
MDYPQEVPCPKCGQLLPFTPRPDTSHFGAIRCPDHGFIWISKPPETAKPRRRRNAELIPTLPADRQAFCWSCLRHRDHLAGLRPALVLNAHHVIEVQHGGTDDPVNLILLCTECHAEVHRRREAFARYL